jgi:hypothetical protein
VSYPQLASPLYHGSTVPVERVDVTKGAVKKDFGRGFYTTADVDQAERFARLKARREGLAEGHVSVFRLADLEGLAVQRFLRSDADWFDFVLQNRGYARWVGSGPRVVWDIVIGPVANDAVGLVLNQFVAGVYGDPGSREAKDTAIRLLLAQKLHGQVLFATVRSAARLERMEAYRVRVE